MKDERLAKLAEEGKCPGSADLKRPKPEYFFCPSCGCEVEIWTDEISGVCEECGSSVPKEGSASCIEWCEHAEKCIGSEKYKKLMGKRKHLKAEYKGFNSKLL